MESAGIVFHVSLLAVYAYVSFLMHFTNKDHPHNEEHKLVDILKMYSFRYLTNWTFLLQLFYFVLSILGHLLGAVGGSIPKTRIHNASDYLFISVSTPMALVVSTIFWVVYAIDRELVLPKVLDLVIPVWMNHVIHTLNSLGAIVDILIINHKVPSWTSSAIGLLTYLLAYTVCLFGTYFQTGIWLYPFMDVMNWPVRFGFAATTLILAFTASAFTRMLHSLIWGQSSTGAEKKKRAAEQKKKLRIGQSMGTPHPPMIFYGSCTVRSAYLPNKILFYIIVVHLSVVVILEWIRDN